MGAHWRRDHPELASVIERLHREDVYERVAAGLVENMSWLRGKFRRDHPELAAEIATLAVELRPDLQRMRNRIKMRELSKRKPAHSRERLRRWKKNNPGKVLEYDARRRARILASPPDPRIQEFYEHVKKSAEACCHICNQPIEIGDRSIDHIIPLARGGKHELTNLAPAHKLCNYRKSDQVPGEHRS